MGQMPHTLEYVKKRIYELDKNYVVVDNNYTDNKIPLKIKHLKCGKIIYISLVNFNRGRRCKYCSKSHKWTNLEFKNKVKELVGDEYTFLDKYINCHTKLRVIHNECKLIYEVEPNNFIRGRRCPVCNRGGIRKYTQEEIEEKIEKLGNGDYKLLSKYENMSKKVVILHKKCGRKYSILPSNFIRNGHRCSYCRENGKSKGEAIIEHWLKKYKIKYEREYGFNDCKYNRRLKFDFMIYNTKDEIFCLIEFDGEQHFHKDSVFWRKKSINSKEAYEIIKRRDKIKNNYCKKNKIPLFRISYKDIKNIHYILAEEIFGKFKEELGIKKKYKKSKIKEELEE